MTVASMRRHALTAGIILATLVVWQLAAVSGLARLGVIASPLDVIHSIVTDVPTYLRASANTASVAARGWVIGTAAAVVVGFLFAQFRTIERLFLRLALVVYCLPLVAVLPILQVTFPPDAARVALAAMAVFFTTLVGAMVGFRSSERGPLLMVRAWGGRWYDSVHRVRLSFAIPAVLTSFQIGVAAAVLGAILAEFTGAESGLGVMLVAGLNSLQLAQVWAVAVIATAMSVVPYAVIALALRLFVPWSGSMAGVDAPTPPAQRGAWGWLGGVGWIVASFAIVIVAWYAFLGVFHVSPFVGKTPLQALGYLTSDPDAASHRDQIGAALGVTATHSIVGYVVGVGSGVLIAVLFRLAPAAQRGLSPLMIALRSVPINVLTPILILALGRGVWSVAAIAAIVTFFPVLTMTSTGLSRVPKDALVLMRSLDASRWTTLWRVELPYALPSLLSSARIAAPLAVLGATIAEWLATGDGLGRYIVVARSYSDYVGLWAGAAVLTALSIVLYSIVAAVESRVEARNS